MTPPPRPFQVEKLRAFVASGRLWLVELQAWLACVFGIERAVARELRRELDDLHRAVALLIFAQARHALTAPDPGVRALRPTSAPKGFVRARENSEMRLLWRCAPRGVGLRARIAALQYAMDNIPGLAARFMRRIRKPYAPALVLRHAPGDLARAGAAPRAPHPADTS